MNNIKAIPTGYKQTEAGIIPEDWDVFLLGDVFDFKNGLNKGKEYFGVGTPIINYMDVYISGGIYSSFVQGKVLVTQEEKKNHSARKGDVFFTRTSETVEEIGLSSVLLDEIKDAVFSGFILRGRQKTDVFVHSFMKYCFRAENLRRQIKNTASYTTRALTNGSMLSKVIAPAPNKKEQSAIGEVLSDTDTLITALEQLITKKKAIKTATMQQLLNGSTRLSQFSKYSNGKLKGYKVSELGNIPEDWALEKIGSLLSITTGGKNTQDKIVDGSYPFFVRSQTVEKINSYSFDCEGVLTAGDGVGTGKIFHYINGKFDFHQRVYLMFNFSDKLDGYFFYIFFSNNFYDRIMSMTAKSSVDSVRREMIADMTMLLPPKTEQIAIANILSDMDAELTALEQKLAKFRDIKQGMMQQLLTGRIRLPLDHQP